jgi:hypothetical protein
MFILYFVSVVKHEISEIGPVSIVNINVLIRALEI